MQVWELIQHLRTMPACAEVWLTDPETDGTHRTIKEFVESDDDVVWFAITDPVDD